MTPSLFLYPQTKETLCISFIYTPKPLFTLHGYFVLYKLARTKFIDWLYTFVICETFEKILMEPYF